MISRLFSSLFVLSFLICGSCTSLKKSSDDLNNTDDQKIEIVLLQINDVYEIAPLQGGKVGGMARIATLKQNLLQKNPNTLAIHAGDFLYPSLIATMKYEGERINGRQMIDVMNAAKIDLATFGNHEFDLKEKDLQKRLNESTFDWVSSNVEHKVGDRLEAFYKFQNNQKTTIPKTWIWKVADQDGTTLKVGFFGVTLPSNRKDYVHYNDFIKSALATANALRNEVDLVIGITHLDLADDLILAEKIIGVPLFIGGHDHDHLLEKVKQTTIAKADANAKTAYIHTLIFDKKTKKVKLNSKLRAIDTNIKEDPTVAKIVKKWTDIADKSFRKSGFDPDEIVAIVNTPLDGRESSIRHRQTNLGKRIAQACFAAGKMNPDCAFFNSGSVRLDDQLKGSIYQFDIIRTLPFGGAVYEVEMTGALLKKVLEVGRKNKGSGGYLQRFQVYFDQNKQVWKIQDKTIKDDQSYVVVLNDFLLLGLEKDMEFLTEKTPGILKVHKPNETDENDIRRDIRLCIVDLMKKMK
ncbi:MAG: bifunctional UDP-sugar hydrolase/5'-nucleotidase [Saprospiraceae bacterium]